MVDAARAGELLVATPLLGDPNFRRTVVLVVEHEPEEGTLGVVLNRPTEVAVGQVLEPWTELATGPPVVFTGGPVAPTSALALALARGDRSAAEAIWSRMLETVIEPPGRKAGAKVGSVAELVAKLKNEAGVL